MTLDNGITVTLLGDENSVDCGLFPELVEENELFNTNFAFDYIVEDKPGPASA